jgi:hypothetical protein
MDLRCRPLHADNDRNAEEDARCRADGVNEDGCNEGSRLADANRDPPEADGPAPELENKNKEKRIAATKPLKKIISGRACSFGGRW